MQIEIITLVLAFAIAVFTAVTGVREYIELKASKGTLRKKLYKHWIAESWLLFGLFSLIATEGNLNTLLAPIQTTQLIGVSEEKWQSDQSSIILGLVIGIILALFILYFRSRRAFKRAANNSEDIILPQNREEKQWAGLMAVTAGITEELFFRALIPALVFMLTNNVAIALTVGIVAFALQHIYQGVKGILGTALIGWVLTKVFMATGTIMAPIALHIFIDLNGLLLFPWLAKRFSPSNR